jgi:hypothetical protein
MKTFLITSIIFLCFSSYAQDFSWKKNCENEKSNAEIGDCLLKSCKEASLFFENLYDNMYEKIKSDLTKAGNEGVEKDILTIYINYLPILKKSLSDMALASAEIDSSSSIDGSGYAIYKLESLLKYIEQNIETLKKIQSEIPTF